MKHLKNSAPLWVLLAFIISAWTLTQNKMVQNPKPPDENANSVRLASNRISTCDSFKRQSLLLQDLFLFNIQLKASQLQAEKRKQERAKEVWQDNEYTVTGKEKGTFLDNPLMLEGKPLDYGEFTLASSGKLTVIKKIAGEEVRVLFRIYLRRDGVPISANKKFGDAYKEIEMSEILSLAEPGDQLVIEAINDEDGAVKRILKLSNIGC